MKNKGCMIAGAVIVGLILIVVAILGWGMGKYNTIVELKSGANGYEASWANVQTDYQRRMDLIPNLVNTVKGYADFERQTLTDVVEARAKATSINIDPTNLTPETLSKFQQAQGSLSSALGRLMVVVEKYPDLKANQNFLELQSQLEGTENRIAVARKRYNETVAVYNAFVMKVPNNMIASMYNFTPQALFQADEAASKAPEVKF